MNIDEFMKSSKFINSTIYSRRNSLYRTNSSCEYSYSRRSGSMGIVKEGVRALEDFVGGGIQIIGCEE